MNNDLKALYAVLLELREKCPWDNAQTMQSLRLHTLEEVHELAAGILSEDPENIQEELGDLLVHLLLYTIMAEEKKWFDLSALLKKTREKMIFRHPHVYGQTQANTQKEVKKTWEIQKTKEKKPGRGLLAGVPQSLPSLIRAYRMQQKLANIGLDLPDVKSCYTHIESEIAEVQTAKDPAQQTEEVGDLLFSVINLARQLEVDPDAALEKSCQKFQRRVEGMETIAQSRHHTLQELSTETLEEYYQLAKQNTKL